MLFSLATAQETLNMRHYDIKLLNFFLTSAASSSPASPDASPDASPASDTASTASHAITSKSSRGVNTPPGEGEDEDDEEDAAFWELPVGREWVVKLADYGTCDIDVSTMHLPMTERHTT
ncbi:hypothetical protein T484DRAFT_1857606 [Baffinella frigidus]|nr:hypothetical protein T484DRAFT_1857606 [Cryptophyta sp. CCMP2293]